MQRTRKERKIRTRRVASIAVMLLALGCLALMASPGMASTVTTQGQILNITADQAMVDTGKVLDNGITSAAARDAAPGVVDNFSAAVAQGQTPSAETYTTKMIAQGQDHKLIAQGFKGIGANYIAKMSQFPVAAGLQNAKMVAADRAAQGYLGPGMSLKKISDYTKLKDKDAAATHTIAAAIPMATTGAVCAYG